MTTDAPVTELMPATADPLLPPASELRDAARAISEQKRRRLEMISETEDRVLEMAQQVAEATLAFQEVDEDQQTPPPDWITRYGHEGAERRLKVARAAWLPTGKVPYAMRMAPAIMVGVAKARGQAALAAKMGPTDVNVKISVPAPATVQNPGLVKYEERELEQ